MNALPTHLKGRPLRDLTLQGDLVPWPRMVRGDDGTLFQAMLPLWVESESGLVHPGELLRPSDDHLAAALEALIGFIDKWFDGQFVPTQIEVRSKELADYLHDSLRGLGVRIQVKQRCKALDAAVRELRQAFGGDSPALRGLVAVRGMTTDRLRAFAEAGAEFYQAAPWQHLSDIDILAIEAPKPPAAMRFASVLGTGGTLFGLGLYPKRAVVDQFMRAADRCDVDADLTRGFAQVTFDDPIELAPDDLKLWDDHAFPLAAPDAYPTAVKHLGGGKSKRPSPRELAFLEGLLRALAATSEDEIDTGRWEKQVITHDGPTTYRLALPDLLNPPAPQELMRRGFMPDRRAHERIFSEMDRFFRDHPVSSAEEMTAEVNRRFAEKSIDDLASEPSSPREQAREMCYQAFDSIGRRRVQLARKAIKVDPDCADAYVILAEEAATVDDRLRHYGEGVRAGEQSLGPERFEQDVGYFWGITATRPYMRARLGLAMALDEAGRRDEAIEHFQELLRLNPQDNQGVRYLLLPRLLASGRDADAARLLKEFDEESAIWAYCQALLAFRLSGRSPHAGRELRTALRVNPHVPDTILAEDPLPQPPAYAPGSYEEAAVYAEDLREAFFSTPDAMEWFVDELNRGRDERRRELRRKERLKAKKEKEKRKRKRR